MICLDIKVKNGYSNYLNKIFNGIDLFNYVWEINADDFLYSENDKMKGNFFGADVLNAEEFIKCISRESYYMIFSDIKAYPLDKERVEINTLKDFLESSCEIVFLCTDSIYIEFYSKSRKILDKVYNNCKGSNFEKVEFKSVDDVLGRSFIAW
ncbi:DUF2691 family protein [Sedimentibacter sp. zth1]|uniref:DUF2691 family protein n=1 Tax=Sedimentibacter sp. zth1 TaxID=2816908 RepID=UPI001A91998F|nr:DUF2691 family protein [Sedimentibacter sp. zth1]QSX06704.1 DUF2691 family protein [Sedimentibacter sp. zth1]